MIVLGIETSCDETAVGIVQDGETLLANAVVSSMDLHAAFGGVVPEIAARSHIEVMTPVIKEALQTAFPDLDEKAVWEQIDAIAVAYGPGLGGSLLVGVMAARALATAKDKPLFGVNHVIAHAYASFLTKTELENYSLPDTQPTFPMLALTVAGGHSQLTLYRDHFDYEVLGKTRDDAIGEAFDKVAKILGLPYPGGPSIATLAEQGDAHKYKLPKAKLDEPYSWSFSGLKTAVLRLAQELIGEDFTFPSYALPERLSDSQKADIAASFQRVAIETIVDKVVDAEREFQPATVVVGGGVAASQELRSQLKAALRSKVEGQRSKKEVLHFTEMKLCTDNGAMIATLGCFMAMKDQPTADPSTLSIEPNLSM